MNSRRHALKSVAAATGLSALGLPLTTWAQSGELVVAAAPPITGVFAFAGVGLNMGVNDYCEWRNEARGGIMGRKLRYISEDSGYKMDQAMAVFKKLMAAHKPPVFYGDSTAWAKAASVEVSQLGTTLTCSPSFASDLADPDKVPYYDYVIFQGYVLAPIPEFIRQMREAGMTGTQFMGTIWSMDKSTAEAMGAVGDGWMGVMPYRYSHDTKDAPAMVTMNQFAQKRRPDIKYVSTFYTHGWLVGTIFAEVMERVLKANKPLTGPNMKAALETMTDWDSGGISGLPVNLKGHQIATGRIYRFDANAKLFEPASGWIRTA